MRRAGRRLNGWFGMIAAFAGACAAGVHLSMAATFQTYQGPASQLPVRFEYPAEWTAEPSSGTTEAYHQVQLFAPPAAGRLHPYISVRAMPLKAQGGRFATVEELVASHAATLLPTLRIDGRRRASAAGTPAEVVDGSGALWLPWKSTHPKEVPVACQWMFFGAGGRLFELSWMATPETAAGVRAAFDHLLSSLTLLEQ